jgi:hypothetical protein
VTGTGLADLGKSEHGNGLREGLEERNVPRLDCREETLRFLLGGLLCTFYLHINYQTILKTDQLYTNIS